MQFSTKGRTAITALIDLAAHDVDDPVTLYSISERQNISVSYLEHLFRNLRKHKIVKSVRGPGGGYLLAGAGLQTTLADIVCAVDGSPETTRYRGRGNLWRPMPQCIDEVWAGLTHTLHRHLATINLQQLASQYALESGHTLQPSARRLPAVASAGTARKRR